MDTTELYLTSVALVATPRSRRLPRATWVRQPSVAECIQLIGAMTDHARRVHEVASTLDQPTSRNAKSSSLTVIYRKAVALTMMPHLFARVRALGRQKATKVQCAWLASALRAYAAVLIDQAEQLRRAAKQKVEAQEDRLATREARRLARGRR